MAPSNPNSISHRLPITNRLALLGAASLVVALLMAILSIAGLLFQEAVFRTICEIRVICGKNPVSDQNTKRATWLLASRPHCPFEYR